MKYTGIDHYSDYCIKNLLGMFFKSSFLYLVILGTVSKEKLLIPSKKSTRGGVWLQEM